MVLPGGFTQFESVACTVGRGCNLSAGFARGNLHVPITPGHAGRGKR